MKRKENKTMKSFAKHILKITISILSFFVFSVFAFATSETENNNNINSANQINLNETVYAQLTPQKRSESSSLVYSDDDYFKINLPSDGYISITINHGYIDSYETMVELADAVLVIWDGKSKGTKYTIEYAEKKNRKQRGLYVDGRMVYNADCVGAYNILRLYLQEKGEGFPEAKGLSSPKKVSVQAVKKPAVVGA